MTTVGGRFFSPHDHHKVDVQGFFIHMHRRESQLTTRKLLRRNFIAVRLNSFTRSGSPLAPAHFRQTNPC